MGENCYYLFYGDPDFVTELVAFQEYRLTTLIQSVTRDVRIDRLFIREDMCYRNGPLISPDLFRKILLAR